MSENDAERVRDEGYDDFLDAVSEGKGFYLECPEGHGSLPPRRVCPYCGATDLHEANLPETGRVETFTTVHVAAPEFVDDVPYVTAVVDFGAVRLTGQIRDLDSEAIEVGMEVAPDVGETNTAGKRVLTFEPQ